MSMHNHKANEYHYIDITHLFIIYTKRAPEEAKRALFHKFVHV